MKFTLSWIKDHLDTDADAALVAERLTSIGLEVESVEDAGARLMEWADAFGLGLFAISGTSIAVAAGMSPGVSVLMGATTAIVGGVARDVLCNEVPKVYQDHRPYALCAVAGSLAFLGLTALGLGSELASLVGIAVATGSRLLAVAFDWQLPGWRLPQK